MPFSLAGDGVDEPIDTVILVDDVCFSGSTIEASRQSLREQYCNLRNAQFWACLLAMPESVASALKEKDFFVRYRHKLESGCSEVYFPWGWTRATSLVAAPETSVKNYVTATNFSFLPKPWGHVSKVLDTFSSSTVQLLSFDAGERTSLHYHVLRGEKFLSLDHIIRIRIFDNYIDLKPWQVLSIAAGVRHQLIALDKPARVLEISDGLYLQRDDIVRVGSDPYGRSKDNGDE